MTVTVWPATVNVPVREAPVVFAATLNVTEPMPEPLAPAVTVIHDVVVVAVQEQDVPEDDAERPAAGQCIDGKAGRRHGAGAAAGSLIDRHGLASDRQRARARTASCVLRDGKRDRADPGAGARW